MSTSGQQWLLYGATGYTGRLTAELAMHRGLEPILAGRNAERLKPLARKLGAEHRVFDLQDSVTLREALRGVTAVLHMAGPFSATAVPMLDACLSTGCHYLDISGEVASFQELYARHERAVAAGVVLMPGVGFDVVPTDCIAAMLHVALPDATELELAFIGLGTIPSPGTTKGWVEGLGRNGLVRSGGELVEVTIGSRARRVTFPSREAQCIAVPLADVVSAHVSTGIANIAVYVAVPDFAHLGIKLLAASRPLFAKPLVQSLLKRLAGWAVKGADETGRSASRFEVWGEARNAAGAVASATLSTPDGYAFTADASLRCLERVLSGALSPGATTPAKALGPEFVLACDDVKLHRAPGVKKPRTDRPTYCDSASS